MAEIWQKFRKPTNCRTDHLLLAADIRRLHYKSEIRNPKY